MANEKPPRRFRSSIISDGLIRATTRSFLYGLGLLRNGDIIAIDARAQSRSIHVELAEEELAHRRAMHTPLQRKPLGGVLEKYAATVGPANQGAVTHSGAVAWPHEE